MKSYGAACLSVIWNVLPWHGRLEKELGNMFKRTFLACAVLVAGGSSAATAQEAVRFSTIDYAPYALSDDPLGRRGLIVDIVTATSKGADVEFTNSILPISRVIKNLGSGVSDCGVFLLTGPTAQNYTQVAKIYDRFDTVFIARKGVALKDDNSLKGRSLAIPRGSFEGASVLEDPEVEIVLTNSIAQSVAMLHAGRVDVVAGTELSILYELSVIDPERDVIGEMYTYDRQQMWLHCAKGQLPEATIEALRRSADALREGGVFDEIMQTYTQSETVSQ